MLQKICNMEESFTGLSLHSKATLIKHALQTESILLTGMQKVLGNDSYLKSFYSRRESINVSS